MATTAQIEAAARASDQPTVFRSDPARGLIYVAYTDERAAAAEREERFHAALKIRQRYRNPDSWLDCLGLSDVPTGPEGWCTCPTPTSTEKQ
ncbi:hypothetical protein OG884_15690 [Streptosporangium sp. NBC_01755]|uniref:hypothetical protein n=1 Tax=Streptosporangium sp. NBC_01755 TaxID=2975949 RepID=UPI002DDBA66B|nr:hypothetical protein [Streptosporangium sp. NBC_01755]WSD03276.1 hypothetical protein OG884_15690 [Streptosporangium sp. NBC_01755]